MSAKKAVAKPVKPAKAEAEPVEEVAIEPSPAPAEFAPHSDINATANSALALLSDCRMRVEAGDAAGAHGQAAQKLLNIEAMLKDMIASYA